jgi:uncharacterized membrane protein
MRVKARLLSIWDNVRSSYWFTPSILGLAAVLLSTLTLTADQALSGGMLQRTAWFYTGSAEGARTLLSTVAGSMAGIAGVVFSVTVVALTLASNQFGSRVLRNFMRDVGNQVVLGTFIATFLYCLLILRQVHGRNQGLADTFVPQISILSAVILAILSMAVLIYFIHHIASSIQAPNVIARVTSEIQESIDDMCPQQRGEVPPEEAERRREPQRQIPDSFERDSSWIPAQKSGYLRRIESGELLRIAEARDLIVRIERRQGQFVVAEEAILRAWPAERVDDWARNSLQNSFAIGRERTIAQDPESGLDQLVEIALLALSPSLNNAFVAMMVVDRLGEALVHLAGRAIPSPYCVDQQGRLRVINKPPDFPKMFDAAFNQIRQNSRRHLAVTLRLLRSMRLIVEHVPDRRSLAHVREHAQMVYMQARETGLPDYDRHALQAHYDALAQAIHQREADCWG